MRRGGQCVAAFCSVSQCVAVCCRVLHCVALCCSMLQCVVLHFKREVRGCEREIDSLDQGRFIQQ